MADAETKLKALMSAGLKGDAVAYRRLLGEAAAHLRAYFVRRLNDRADAEDLVQETLIAIHAKRATYDARQPLTPWLYAIARYKLIDHFRRAGRRPTVALEDLGDLAGRADYEEAGAKGDVERLLAKLPARTQDLMRGVKLEGLSTAEAAARSGMSESAVKVAVHRAIRSLSSIVRREENP